jgi:tetratricopeptide (TPR) repeat protein
MSLVPPSRLSDEASRQAAPGASGSALEDSAVIRAVQDYLRSLEAGVKPDRQGFLERYASIAEELAACLDALEFVQGAACRLSQPGVAAEALAASEEVPPVGPLGDFRIVGEVGRGGMGIVYEAEQISLGRRVALKVLPFAATLDPKQLQRFHNEARAAAGLHHTNIVPVYAVGCERGVHYYAMQFIDGRTLAELIAGQRPTTPTVDEADAASASTVPQAAQVASAAPRDTAYFRRIAEWGIQAAEALDHAHQLGVVHRDVKPANLLVDGGGRLWVTDFGLAQVHSDARLTMTGDLVGTLRYVSPEQALAKRVVIDHRTDVYSLGATLYELLTLEPVFGGRDRQEVLRQIAFEEPRRPRRVNRAVPAELETIVLKALEKRPQDRYATAQEMADDLQRWLRDEPIRARRPTLFQRAAKWGRRHRPVVAAGVTVLLMVLVLASYLGWVHHGREMQRAAMERAVLTALEESDSWQAQRRLPEALSAARRAAGLLAGGDADDALRQRVWGRVADLEKLDKLQNVHLERVFLDRVAGGKSGLALYEQTFREAGLDVEALPREEVAERISASTVAAELAGVLDEWAWYRRKVKGEGDTGWKDLLWIARTAEPEAWRNGVRDALECRDLKALAALASSDKVFRLMPPTLYVLGDALLRDKRAASQAEGMLREAHRRQPDDFWLNINLFDFSSSLRSSREERLRFASTAVAIRPGSPYARANLGDALRAKGRLDEAIAEYRVAILLKEDFWTRYILGMVLEQKGQLDEAIAEWREAIRLNKDCPWTHVCIGDALYRKGQLDEAIAKYREAIGLYKFNDGASAHFKLGMVLKEKGQLDEAIAEYREAIRLGQDNAGAHRILGAALKDKGQLDEAIAEFRVAIRLMEDSPMARYENSPMAHYDLGNALRDKGQLDEAIAEFRVAILLKEDYAEAHCNLGGALEQKGQFAEALVHRRRGHELGSRDPRWSYPSTQRDQNRERLVDLNGKLEEVLSGHRKPADVGERLSLAGMCQRRERQHYLAAARFYDEAFTEKPQLADDLTKLFRYNAACAAALAGCGQGEEADKLDEKERARLRQQALDWLRADLKAYRQLMDKAADKVSGAVAKKMQHWLQDDDFAGVRGAEALARLPQGERSEWEKLWQEIEALRQRAAQRPAAASPARP